MECSNRKSRADVIDRAQRVVVVDVCGEADNCFDDLGFNESRVGQSILFHIFTRISSTTNTPFCQVRWPARSRHLWIQCSPSAAASSQVPATHWHGQHHRMLLTVNLGKLSRRLINVRLESPSWVRANVSFLRKWLNDKFRHSAGRNMQAFCVLVECAAHKWNWDYIAPTVFTRAKLKGIFKTCYAHVMLVMYEKLRFMIILHSHA